MKSLINYNGDSNFPELILYWSYRRDIEIHVIIYVLFCFLAQIAFIVVVLVALDMCNADIIDIIKGIKDKIEKEKDKKEDKKEDDKEKDKEEDPVTEKKDPKKDCKDGYGHGGYDHGGYGHGGYGHGGYGYGSYGHGGYVYK